MEVSLNRKDEKKNKNIIVMPKPGAIFKVVREPGVNGLALCALFDGIYTLPDGKTAYAKNVKWAYINVSDIAKAVNSTLKGKVVLYYVKEEDVIEVND